MARRRPHSAFKQKRPYGKRPLKNPALGVFEGESDPIKGLSFAFWFGVIMLSGIAYYFFSG